MTVSASRKTPADFLRFAVAGAVGFVVDSLTLLALVQGAGWQPLPARLVSMPVAILATWLINRLWTFRAFTAGKSLRNIGAEFLGYCTVQVTGGRRQLSRLQRRGRVCRRRRPARTAGRCCGRGGAGPDDQLFRRANFCVPAEGLIEIDVAGNFTHARKRAGES